LDCNLRTLNLERLHSGEGSVLLGVTFYTDTFEEILSGFEAFNFQWDFPYHHFPYYSVLGETLRFNIPLTIWSQLSSTLTVLATFDIKIAICI
jgi:hypothetical protein